MAGGRLSETFAPRLGVNLLWLVPAVAVLASLISSILVFTGLSVVQGGEDAFLKGLLLALFAAMFAVFFVLGGLLVLAVPLSFVLRAAKVKWLVVVGIAVVLAVAGGALFGAAQESPDFPWVGMTYGLVTAMTWLLALHRFAGTIQHADIDDPLLDAA